MLDIKYIINNIFINKTYCDVQIIVLCFSVSINYSGFIGR